MSYKVAFISLGCAKNQVNCEQMMATVQAAGYTVTAAPEEADVAVVNTCGFLASACGEAIDNILEMAELKKELEAAKKLPAVTGYDEEQKNYSSFLSSVESFMKDMQKARDKGAYSDADYNAMSEAYEYGLSVI